MATNTVWTAAAEPVTELRGLSEAEARERQGLGNRPIVWGNRVSP